MSAVASGFSFEYDYSNKKECLVDKKKKKLSKKGKQQTKKRETITKDGLDKNNSHC